MFVRLVVMFVGFHHVFSQSVEYGPPRQQPSSGNNGTSNTMYGPPGFLPGQPLDHYSSSGSSNNGGGPCRNTDPEANRRMVLEFYQKIFGDKQFDLLDQYIAEDMINHNPMEADGREALLHALMGPLGQGPKMKVDIKRSCANDDLVWTHTRLPLEGLGATYAAADIFRINCAGLIQEHWDVLQDTNVQSMNSHPFF